MKVCSVKLSLARDGGVGKIALDKYVICVKLASRSNCRMYKMSPCSSLVKGLVFCALPSDYNMIVIIDTEMGFTLSVASWKYTQ